MINMLSNEDTHFVWWGSYPLAEYDLPKIFRGTIFLSGRTKVKAKKEDESTNSNKLGTSLFWWLTGRIHKEWRILLNWACWQVGWYQFDISLPRRFGNKLLGPIQVNKSSLTTTSDIVEEKMSKVTSLANTALLPNSSYFVSWRLHEHVHSVGFRHVFLYYRGQGHLFSDCPRGIFQIFSKSKCFQFLVCRELIWSHVWVVSLR